MLRLCCAFCQVGLVPDSEILRCKGPPILNDGERLKLVESVKWVDEVLTGERGWMMHALGGWQVIAGAGACWGRQCRCSQQTAGQQPGMRRATPALPRQQ